MVWLGGLNCQVDRSGIDPVEKELAELSCGVSRTSISVVTSLLASNLGVVRNHGTLADVNNSTRS